MLPIIQATAEKHFDTTKEYKPGQDSHQSFTGNTLRGGQLGRQQGKDIAPKEINKGRDQPEDEGKTDQAFPEKP